MLQHAIVVLNAAGWKVGLMASVALCFLSVQYFRQIVVSLKLRRWKVGALLPLARYFRVAEVDAGRPRTVLRQFWFNARMAFTRECMVLAFTPLIIIVPGLIAQKVGTGWIDLGLGNPQTVPEFVLALLAWLLIYDFFYYWFHRLQHGHWFFWAGHRVHHSDEAINPSTSFRSHWLEAFMQPFLSNLAVVILFKPIGIGIWTIYFVVASIGFFAHCNLRMSLGPWFVSPQYHRIHHSLLPEHQDKNFVFAFPFYDVIFGTYYRAAKQEYPPTGLYGGEREHSVWRANVVAFKIWYDGFSDWFARLRRLGRASQRQDVAS